MSDPETEIAAVLASGRTVVSDDGGCRVVWRVFGEGRPVLLVHGNFGAWSHWIRVIPLLSRHYLLLVPDLPGFGDSEEPASPHSLRGLAQMLYAGARHIVGDGRPIAIVGFSFGCIFAGAIAMVAAAEADQLVLMSSGGLGLPREAVRLEKWRGLSSREESDVVHRRNLEAQMFGDPGRIDELAILIQSMNVPKRRFPAETVSADTPLLGILPALQCQISGIFGSADKSIGPHIQTRLEFFRDLRVDANIAVVSGAGHWLQYETPAAFERIVTRILDSAERGWTAFVEPGGNMRIE